MPGDNWTEGALWHEKGEYMLGRIRYCLTRMEEPSGFVHDVGAFVLQEESCPVHTGLVQLRTPEGRTWLVRILRISRPHRDGEFEVIEPVA